jgi:hypothetical protein
MLDMHCTIRKFARQYSQRQLDDTDDLMRLAHAIRTNVTPSTEPPEVTTLLGPRHGWKHYGEAA